MANDRQLALTEVGTNEVEIMNFFLDVLEGGEVVRLFYGVNVAKVLKIIRLPERVMQPPELSHPSIRGLFLYQDRNRVIPLIGLAAYLEQKRALDENLKVIITEFNEVITAFLVSGVTRIHRVQWSDVEQPDELIAQYSNNAFTGMVKLDGHVVFILDLEKIVLELDPRAGDTFYSLDMDQILAERQVRILHVDDQVVVRKMVKRALEQNDMFTVISAGSGKEALDWLHEHNAKAKELDKDLHDYVDVVISDIEMPIMDGYTLCKNIKDSPDLQKLPVYLFSSLITDQVVHKGASVGANGQFPKPRTEGMAKEILSQLAKRFLAHPPR